MLPPARRLAPVLSPLLAALLLALPARAAPKKGGGRKKPQPGWKTDLFLRPVAGASVWSSDGETTTAARLGARAGLRYWEVRKPFPRWSGVARVEGAYIIAGDATGYDVRVGNFVGPWWEHWGLSTGPDLFYNRFRWGETELPATTGLSWPATVNGRLEIFTAHAGLQPSWYFADDRRRVDWSETSAPGFGHEFSYLAGVGVKLDKLRVGLDWAYRITAYGEETVWGVSANLAGLGIGL